jgi:pimeloyl-ACP methyl ester carboxylesterase
MKASIVLIPGMMCTKDVFISQINYLNRYFNVIVLEFNQYDNIMSGVKDLAPNLPDDFHLLGHSMGGIVAMEFVRQFSERVLSLALLNTNPYEEKEDLREKRNQRLKELDKLDLITLMKSDFISRYFPSNCKGKSKLIKECVDMVSRLDKQVFYNQSIALRDRSDQSTTLESVTCKTLLVCGEKDKLCPVSYHSDMKKMIKKCDFMILEGVGHMPSLECPGTLNNHLKNFFSL